MKKLFIAVALIAVSGVALNLSAGSASIPVASASVSSMQAETYEVTAVRNPSAGVKVRGHFTVTWDGDNCYVVARDGKYFDNPIPASYSTTYPGYPYTFSYNNQTWYFSL